MIASNLLGSQKKRELSLPHVLRLHIWRTSGPFCGGQKNNGQGIEESKQYSERLEIFMVL